MSLTKKNLAVIILGLFSIATVLHLVNYYAGLSIPPMVLVGARWVTVAFAIVYALKKGSLTTWILLSMIIGVEIGLNYPHFAQNLQVLSKIFLSLVKTIIAPILFSTLVVGIAVLQSSR
ncbi:MAG TPA: cation:dicarboxylase symporter family transporter [Cyclobacteriaceae bacterium]|nr:cation:dicarboxylase symporter family transporter [Cyclobacteriaceae bacterium]